MRHRSALLLAFACGASAVAGADVSKNPALSFPAAPLTVARGFEVTLIHTVSREAAGSWVSLAADDRGRLYASDQYGPLQRISLSGEPGGTPLVRSLPLPLGGAHGLAWIDGCLYAVVGQKAVRPAGLYRIRDTDRDGELDQVELLRELDGDGEHGPHGVVPAPNGRSLYIVAGNGTRLPDLVRSRVPRLWADDSLLAPLPALMGSETRGILPGGWIARTDLNGRAWELVCAGLRNAYALAADSHGELFTFDSDTEFELNLPWYRPTRVLHAVSGADFGWRRGALKVPDRAPDIWPAVLPMGLGSPTAVLFASHARLPAAYRQALWVADWSYGKLFALRLKPQGASFTASREEIVAGLPLPITAVCVNPSDGALYFTTGGRRLPSALYRLRWTGGPGDTAEAIPPPTVAAQLRHRLESFHGREDAAAVDAAWPALGSADPFIRRAARVALESQPVNAWRARALAERVPLPALAALLALARADATSNQREILDSLRILPSAQMEPALLGEWLRVVSLTFSRGGDPPAEARADWMARLDGLWPTHVHGLDAALVELLAYGEAPGAAKKGVEGLRNAVTREAQLDFAKTLRVLRATWTPALRREFFHWLAATHTWRGGGTFARFLQRLRDDALASAPESERTALRQILTSAAEKTAPAEGASVDRKFVRAWTTDDLTMLAQKDTRTRNPARGRKLFGAAGCFACHTFDDEGAALGPDLTAVARRLSVRDLFEAIIEPSRAISDQYGTVQIQVRDGRQLTGRIVNLTETGLHLAENLADPSNVVRLIENDIMAIEPSKVSLMPAGMLDIFSDDEILDLLAFLRSTPMQAGAP